MILLYARLLLYSHDGNDITKKLIRQCKGRKYSRGNSYTKSFTSEFSITLSLMILTSEKPKDSQAL